MQLNSYLIKNLPISFFKNQTTIERFNSTVRDKDIIKKIFPTPDWEASFPSMEMDLSFMKIKRY